MISSKYFTFNELTRSDTAKKLKIDNEPKEEATKDNLTTPTTKVVGFLGQA